MALHLKIKTQGRLDLTGKKMAERFKNYKSKYWKAHILSCSTGFGLTDKDQKAGIHTVAEKLESICPFYSEMDSLFGNRANITPLSLADSQEEVTNEKNKDFTSASLSSSVPPIIPPLELVSI